ncbi:MAG: quinohemoprotein amine dehydrogenase subunit alpha [Deltaproteobacteria bacterium]|nr:quinohemoprotein amine dehydrogenase subunit alpha [Deltaproteobacteria bacterium]
MRRVLLGAFLGAALAAPALAETPQELLRNTCGGCHQSDASGGLSRIAHQRKTPEGWAMTIQRMEDLHGITVSSQSLPLGSADAKRTLIKHLADTQGLAPSETEGFRYALEQRLDEFEPVDADFKMMCGRCHSAARVLLQRRPVDEWRELVHFHLGQWPSTEYSAGGRNLDWFPVALNETAPMLAEKYAYESAAWEKWKKAKKPDLSGSWSVSGHQPSKGPFEGRLRATPNGADEYAVELSGEYLRSGEKLAGSGRATVYTGYEWRATLTVGDVKWQQVFAAGQRDGLLTLAGRMYERDHHELGMQLEAISERTPSMHTLAPGANARMDRITVEPPYQVARVGDGGGPIPKEYAVFDAVAWSNGADGKPETADDVRIGALPATWRVEPWNEQAREERDVEFAGVMDPATGVFTPGDAGPNPARKYGTNNVGNLKVIATLKDGERELTADAHLIVTVQRWIHSPIP